MSENRQNRHRKAVRKVKKKAAAKATATQKPAEDATRGAYKEHMKEPFIKAFRESGTILQACLSLDIDRQTILNWRESDTDFNRSFIEADTEVTEKIEGPALQRVVNGKPIYWMRNGQPVLDQAGNPIILYREYPEDLVKFMLSRRNRKKYGEKIEVELSGEFSVRFATEMVAIIKRNVPQNCPHCNNNLAISSKIAKELETITAKMNTP